MPRTLFSPTTGTIREAPLSLKDGGTGANTAAGALANLQAIPSSLKDVANGIAVLGSDLKAKPENIPPGITTAATVMGPLTTYTGMVTTHVITNYDVITTYDVVAKTGTVSLTHDTITYTAPETAGDGGFFINGKLFGITVAGVVVGKPKIDLPTMNAEIGVESFLAFSGTNTACAGPVGTLNRDWQRSTDPSFATGVVGYTGSGDGDYPFRWMMTDLQPGTTYYLRCRIIESLRGITSDWSDVVTFTTLSHFVANTYTANLTVSEPTNIAGVTSLAVNTDGSLAFVAAANIPGAAGAVYVFSRNVESWTQIQKLTPSDGASGDHFGSNLAMDTSGTYLAVAADTCPAASQRGAVYVFKNVGNGWTQIAKLVSVDNIDNSRFGQSIAISNNGDVIAIGAKNPGSFGAVYIFRKNSDVWNYETKLTVTVENATDSFGECIALSSDGVFLVAGIVQRGNGSSISAGQGIIHCYKNSGSIWTVTTTLAHGSLSTQPDGHVGAPGTIALSADGLILAVGDYGSQACVTYYKQTNMGDFTFDSARYKPADTSSGGANTSFGTRVGLTANGKYCIASAPSSDGEKGSLYIFGQNPTGQLNDLVRTINAPTRTAGDNFGQIFALSGDGSTLVAVPNKTGYSANLPTAVYR